ncbi:MAG: GrpB family protein, partial [Parcubacteria group bacterium]|nr:GrpB family protein [Parcubacteria group bacterium]
MSEIGLKRGTVKLVPHSPVWDKLFRVEKEKLLEVLGDLVVDIQHVGSTAIPTISAKPIIDIAILVRSLKEAEKCAGRIEALG